MNFFDKTPLVAASEVRMGMHLVLVNILICYRGEDALVLDFHQRNLPRRSHPEVFLEISQNSREKRLKKRLGTVGFPLNFAKFLRTPFLTEYLWWLLLSPIQ